MSDNNRCWTTRAARIAVAAVFLSVFVPTATAHECASYENCDAQNCPDGENHEHKDYNYVKRDEYCASSATPENPPERCIIADREFPRSVCRIVDMRPAN